VRPKGVEGPREGLVRTFQSVEKFVARPVGSALFNSVFCVVADEVLALFALLSHFDLNSFNVAQAECSVRWKLIQANNISSPISLLGWLSAVGSWLLVGGGEFKTADWLWSTTSKSGYLMSVMSFSTSSLINCQTKSKTGAIYPKCWEAQNFWKLREGQAGRTYLFHSVHVYYTDRSFKWR